MTKEQLLQLVSEAYDEGARFSINLHPDDEKTAGELADQFAEHFTTACETEDRTEFGWHKFEEGNITFISFYQKEEKLCVSYLK
jgi:hypothetical protein